KAGGQGLISARVNLNSDFTGGIYAFAGGSSFTGLTSGVKGQSAFFARSNGALTLQGDFTSTAKTPALNETISETTPSPPANGQGIVGTVVGLTSVYGTFGVGDSVAVPGSTATAKVASFTTSTNTLILANASGAFNSGVITSTAPGMSKPRGSAIFVSLTL